MSSDYPEQDVGSSSGRRGLGIIDTLQSFRQNVETVVRQSRFEISGGQVDQIDAPEELDEYVDYAKRVGFVWKALDIFANDVWEPGYRLEGPERTRAYFLGDSEDVDAQPPEDTPGGGFLDNAAVFAGEKHQDFYDFGKATTVQRWLRGTVLVELLKADEDDADSEITGFYFIRPETVSAEVYPNTNILIDPEDTDQPGVELTKRGEAASYIQFDDQSILGRQGKFDDDREEIPLSQNDVQKLVLNPGIGDDAADEQGVFGTSVIEPISEDIAEYLQIKRDQATAISNKAHGFWLIEHGRDVLELPNGDAEIIEWDDDSMDDFENKLSKVDPGGHVTYDGSVNVNREEGDVPDLSDEIGHYVQSIIAALPTPKYKIGFEDDVNRDVTSEQNSDYERVISEARQYQETQWTQTFKEVAERKGLPTEGLRFKIEPEPEDSPVLSLSETEIQKLATYAKALNELAGPSAGPQTLVDAETLLTDVAQLPDASMQDAAEEMEGMDVDEETEALFRESFGMGDTDFRDALEWNPELHPRGDDGKFVERVGSGTLQEVSDATNHNELESLVKDATGVENVSLPVLDEGDNRAELAATLVRAGRAGLTENVETIRPGSGEEHGVYNFNDNRLEINRGVSSEELEGLVDENFSVGETLEWLTLHELGHASHQRELDSAEAEAQVFESSLVSTRDGEFVGRERLETVEENVSEYARSNPGELVAEVFAGKALGKDYPPEIMEMYREWSGSEDYKNYANS